MSSNVDAIKNDMLSLIQSFIEKECEIFASLATSDTAPVDRDGIRALRKPQPLRGLESTDCRILTICEEVTNFREKASDLADIRKEKTRGIVRDIIKVAAKQERASRRPVDGALVEIARRMTAGVQEFWKSSAKIVAALESKERDEESRQKGIKQLTEFMQQTEEFTGALSKELSGHLPAADAAGSRGAVSKRDRKGKATPPQSSVNLAVSAPTLLRGSMRPYQQEGLNWLMALNGKGLNGILADEMGLGKTIMTISLLAKLADMGQWGPHLIVVPASVMVNWEIELRKWLPGFKVVCYFGSQAERKAKRAGWARPNSFHVCIVSYQLLLSDERVFASKKWNYLILDEAHQIKNFNSKKWIALSNLNVVRKLLLTGTPLQNDVIELWSLLHFLMPNLFQNHEEFLEWFRDPLWLMVLSSGQTASSKTKSGATAVNLQAESMRSSQMVKKLHEILRPFVLRRLKKDVEKDMPGKYEHIVRVPLSKRQRAMYDEFTGHRDSRVDGNKVSSVELAKSKELTDYFGLMNMLMQLRKVCNHPDLFEPRLVRSPFVMTPVPPVSLSDRSLRWVRLAPEPPAWALVLHWHCRVFLGLTEKSNSLTGNMGCHFDSGSGIECECNGSPASVEWIDKSRAAFFGQSSFDSFRAFAASQRHTITNDIGAACRRNVWISRSRDVLVQSASCIPGVIFRRIREPCRRMVESLRADFNIRDMLSVDYRPFHILCPAVVASARTWLESSQPSGEILSELSCRLTGSGPSEKQRNGRTNPSNLGASQCDLGRLDTKSCPSRSAQAKALAVTLGSLHSKSLQVFPDPRALIYDAGKLVVLSHLCRRLRATGHKVVIFTQMTKMLDPLEKFMNLEGFTYVRLDGGTKIEERQKLVDRFNMSSKIFAFLSSTRSGGVGINLTSSDTVIFYDNDWNPAMDRQAMDRCHRIGQVRDVHIYRLISENTIEEQIFLKQLEKRQLDEIVMDLGQFDLSSFDHSKYVQNLSKRPAKDSDELAEEGAHSNTSQSDVPDLISTGQSSGTTARDMMTSMLNKSGDTTFESAINELTKRTDDRLRSAVEDAEDVRALGTAIKEGSDQLGQDDFAGESSASSVSESGSVESDIPAIARYAIGYLSEIMSR